MYVNAKQYGEEFGDSNLESLLNKMLGAAGQEQSDPDERGKGGRRKKKKYHNNKNKMHCSTKRGIQAAANTVNQMNQCAMNLLRQVMGIINGLLGMVGGALPAIPIAELSRLISMLSGGLSSLGMINMGIIKLHVEISVDGKNAAAKSTAASSSLLDFDIKMGGNTESLVGIVKSKRPLSETLKTLGQEFMDSQPLWMNIKSLENDMEARVKDIRDHVQDIDRKEKQALDTLNNIFGITNAIKALICDIFAMLLAFLALFQSLSIAIGITGTIVAEIVQILQAVLSVIASLFAFLQDMINFLLGLVNESENNSLKEISHTLSLVKEKFKALKYAPFGTGS